MADEIGADLIALGSHGRSGLLHYFSAACAQVSQRRLRRSYDARALETLRATLPRKISRRPLGRVSPGRSDPRRFLGHLENSLAGSPSATC